ncbi:hypothetical protein [Varibaculum prostatecancerukia]|uniref:hypothetical protein n=1 Tax=Varibaculum prostatecancerukia TaxID=2811781 RepID=UPI001C001597|nr:hypothetical protein [Varibaculum prostatecancerukia]
MAILVAPSIPMNSTRLEEPSMVAAVAFFALMFAGAGITLVGIVAASAITTILGGLMTVVSTLGVTWSHLYFKLKGE